MSDKPRPYQEAAIEEIRNYFAAGVKKVLLKLPTGGGKTFVFCRIMDLAVKKNKRCIMVVRGRKLVDQASKRLLRERIPHGVLMAGHWNYCPTAPIQVCSIDTLRSRKLYPKADLVVYDEAHFAISPSYMEFVDHYPDAFHLPVTATPFVDKPLTHIAQVVVNPITVQDLIDQGFLVPARYFYPSQVDLTGVKTSSATKDYVIEDLEKVMNNSAITGDIIDNWIAKGESRPTIIFAVSIAHSLKITEEFNARGIKAIHIEANTPEKEREEAIKKLEIGEVKVISNVGILCTGVDIPPLSCIIMARPTKSYNLYIQQAGRGTRPFQGKQDFFLFDHVGNILRHGLITDEREVFLDGKPKKEIKSPSLKTCSNCYNVVQNFVQVCPRCGNPMVALNQNGKRELEQVDGELVELSALPIEVKAKQRLEQLKQTRKANGYKRGWVFHRLASEFGEELAQKIFPKPNVPDWIKAKFAKGSK